MILVFDSESRAASIHASMFLSSKYLIVGGSQSDIFRAFLDRMRHRAVQHYEIVRFSLDVPKTKKPVRLQSVEFDLAILLESSSTLRE